GVSGRVADHVRVESGHEAAIGAALGVFADALLVEQQDDAAAAVATATERDLGRLRAVIAGAAAFDEAPRIDGLTRATDVITDAPQGVIGLLGRSYLADTI